MEKEYSVLLCSDYDWYIVDAMKAIGCEDYEIDDVHFESYVLERLTEGGVRWSNLQTTSPCGDSGKVTVQDLSIKYSHCKQVGCNTNVRGIS